MIGWGDNDRGVSYTFGRDIVRDFTSRHGISLICRAHQVVEDGYQFFEQRKVLYGDMFGYVHKTESPTLLM